MSQVDGEPADDAGVESGPADSNSAPAGGHADSDLAAGGAAGSQVTVAHSGSGAHGGHPYGIDPMVYGIRFWLSVLVGWLIIGFGIHSAWHTYQASRPIYSFVTLALFAVLNDLVIAPAVILIGLGLRKVLKPSPQVAIGIGVALISVLVTAFSWPAIRRYGNDPALPSLDPSNYATGLLTVLGVVWGSAAVVLIIRLLLRRRAAQSA